MKELTNFRKYVTESKGNLSFLDKTYSNQKELDVDIDSGFQKLVGDIMSDVKNNYAFDEEYVVYNSNYPEGYDDQVEYSGAETGWEILNGMFSMIDIYSNNRIETEDDSWEDTYEDEITYDEYVKRMYQSEEDVAVAYSNFLKSQNK